MRKIRVLIALLVLPALIFAQSTTAKLAGVVTDNDGNALVGANVVVEGTNLGAATDELGRYYILDVPVGTYTVRAEYIGYSTVVENGVRTSVGFTTTTDFALSVAAVAGQEVTVTRERPLINPNATNTTRIVDKELIDAFAVRGVSNIVNLQTGVVNGFFRGSRSGDNRYFVDGVPVKDAYGGGNFINGNSQTALQEVSVQTGGFSAEYGGANGGIVNITTKTGGSAWRSKVEAIASMGSDSGTDPDKLYSDGYENLNFDLGGPIGDNVKLYMSVEQRKFGGSVSWGSYPTMDAHELTEVPADYYSDGTDGLEYGEDANGNKIWHIEDVIRDNQVDPALLAADVADYDTTHVVYSNYRRMYGQQPHDGSDRTTVNGNMTMDFGPLRVKVGTQAYEYSGNGYSYGRTLAGYTATGAGSYNESTFAMGYVNFRYTISPLSYVKFSLSNQDYESTTGNENFMDDLGAYGKRTKAFGSTNYYLRRDGWGPLNPGELLGASAYGSQYNYYNKRNTTTNTFSFDYTNQIGYNEFKMGGSIDNTEISRYGINSPYGIARAIAAVDSNFDGVASDQEILDADGTLADWKFINYRTLYVTNLGYNIYGDEWNGTYNQSDHMQAPAEPTQSRFYVQDKLEFKDVVLQVGLSFEEIDTGAMAPDSDGDGYGDSDGFNHLYFNRQRVDRNGDGSGNFVWKKVKAETAVHPRIGFSFPVSDRTVFRANYGTHWQSVPMSYLYLSDSQLSADILAGNATASENPALKPERSTQYEIGIEQRIGAFASLKVEGFYKESKDYLTLQNRLEAFTSTSGAGAETQQNWAQYLNGDVMVSQGLTMNFEMRRTKGLYAQANYTYSEARGTGSYGSQNFYITWIGTDDGYPKAMNLLDHDQTHTANVILDWRSPDATGFLANTGFNAVMSYGSGTRYTPSQIYSTLFEQRWEFPEGPVNSGTQPTYTNIDLRVDRGFSLGNLDANLFVAVYNALDAEHPQDVYHGTGNVAEDGWLATQNGQNWLANRLAANPDVDAEALYYDALGSPGRWGAPRSIRVGLNISF